MARFSSREEVYSAPLNVAVYNGAYPDSATFLAKFLSIGTEWKITPFFSFAQLETALSQGFDVIVTHRHTEHGSDDYDKPLSLKRLVGRKCVVAVTWESRDEEALVKLEECFDVVLRIPDDMRFPSRDTGPRSRIAEAVMFANSE